MELDPKYDHYDFPTTAPVEAPGHPGHLKPAEQAQVHQLRMLLEAEGFTKRLDTITLVSFLTPPGEVGKGGRGGGGALRGCLTDAVF